MFLNSNNMKYLFSTIIFSMMIHFAYQSNDEYRIYSFKLFEENFCEYNHRDYIKNDYSKYLCASDTANIKINIPIFTLLNPEVNNRLYDYTKLNPLIDFFEDYESQYIIIKKENNHIAIVSTIGVSKRWLKYTKEKILTDDLIDIKIIPYDKIVWKENFNFGYKHFSIEKLEEYVEVNPELRVFSIYNMDGLFCIKDNKLSRLNFTKKGIEELDGEVYYQKNIINKGYDKIKDIIIGGDPFWIK